MPALPRSSGGMLGHFRRGIRGCGVPKLASCLQIADFSQCAPNFGTPHTSCCCSPDTGTGRNRSRCRQAAWFLSRATYPYGRDAARGLANVAATVAAPAFAGLLDRNGGDNQRSRRIHPPEPEQRVRAETDQERDRQPRSRHRLPRSAALRCFLAALAAGDVPPSSRTAASGRRRPADRDARRGSAAPRRSATPHQSPRSSRAGVQRSPGLLL
jgi:hypothetical protein